MSFLDRKEIEIIALSKTNWKNEQLKFEVRRYNERQFNERYLVISIIEHILRTCKVYDQKYLATAINVFDRYYQINELPSDERLADEFMLSGLCALMISEKVGDSLIGFGNFSAR